MSGAIPVSGRTVKNRASVVKSCVLALLMNTTIFSWSSSDLHLTQHDVLETHGLSVLLFHNEYHRVFGDQKMNGMEIILHDQRIATGGDVRLSATPEQWDPILISRKESAVRLGMKLRPSAPMPIEVELPDRHSARSRTISSRRANRPARSSCTCRESWVQPEFLPTLYFGKSYLVDAGEGMFPRHADGPMEKTADGTVQPLPLATGRRIVLSPEDPSTRVTITSEGGPILLFDGRNKAQNGWFVVRTLIPAGKTGDVVVWHIHPNVISGWTRPPVVGYNQVGYTPSGRRLRWWNSIRNLTRPRGPRIAPDSGRRVAARGVRRRHQTLGHVDTLSLCAFRFFFRS